MDFYYLDIQLDHSIKLFIGSNLGAILISGYDELEAYRETIADDVKTMKNILTSKYPLVFGLR